eukprot:5352181-Pyramimonas_sp.AAC.1
MMCHDMIMLCQGVLCDARLGSAVLCSVVFCHVMVCSAMCSVMLCWLTARLCRVFNAMLCQHVSLRCAVVL